MAPADIVFVGEAPGRYGADQTGIPFTQDRSGRLLRLVIEDLSGRIEGELRVFVTNAVKCNPRDNQGRNRKPFSAEVAACREYLEAELQLVQPRVIVPLGALATLVLLGTRQVSWWQPSGEEPVVFPAKHPGYVVRGGGSERLTPKKYIHSMRRILKYL